MNNVTRLECEIAKALGVIDVLRRINRGDAISGNNTGTALVVRGLLHDDADRYARSLTDARRALLARARAMGF